MSGYIRNGVLDYLEILKMSGITEIDKLMPMQQTPPQALPQQRTGLPPQNVSPPPRKTLQEAVNEIIPDKSVLLQNQQESIQEKISQILSPPEPLAKDKKIELLAKEVAKCSLCQELALARIQTVFGQGNLNSELVFLGEAPGADEDQQGIPFVGRSGQLLNDIITKGMKISRDDVYICNILRCRPPGNRNPLPIEAERCRPFLDATLEVIKPKFICCLGTVAAQNLLHTNTPITKLRGQVLEYNASFGTVKVVCTYHPSYLLRTPSAKSETWKDIQLLMNEMELNHRQTKDEVRRLV